MRAILASALVLACAAQAQAQPARPRLPAAVNAYVAELNKECRSYGGSPGSSPDLVKSADLTGDGLPDHVVSHDAYRCDGAASAMGAGQSGAYVAIFASGPGGLATKAFGDTVYGATIETKAGRSVVLMSVAGLACGQRNAASVPFSQIKSCDRPLAWIPAKRIFDYTPMSQMRPLR
ncbi:hypothetical protein [Phenylobacterium sp.]|uniref:hypothetical protein n=1 Tax=Phenylobacterium sp. TaxID=1871053 RepID=UPI00286C6D80|nr:hypothetical protein [Phenylobacterium sp.]